jgi:four helix bundle protein
MHDFKGLRIWQDAMSLVKNVFLSTAQFPASEKYGLISQINRAPVSLPSNIAEGAGRESVKDFSHFFSIALGSAYELETQMLLSESFGFQGNERFLNMLHEIRRLQKMLVAFKRSLLKIENKP